MNTFWVIHNGAFVFRNMIMNLTMKHEVEAIALNKGKILNTIMDRRTDFRNYYDIPSEEEYSALLTHI